MVGTQMNVSGVIVGYLMPILFVDNYTEGDDLTPDKKDSYKKQVFNMLITVAAIALTLTFLAILTFRERPGVPIFGTKDKLKELEFTKKTDEGNQVAESVPLMEQFKRCVRNKIFVFTGLASNSMLIHLYLMTTVVGQLTAAYGISDTDFLNKMAMYMPAFGIVGGILYSIILTWYPGKMMLGAYSVNIGLIISLAFFYYVDSLANRTLLCVASSLIGFFLFPMIFIAFELAVAQTVSDGVGDTMSCGLLNCISNPLAFAIDLSLTPLLTKETPTATAITFAIMFANLGIALVFLVLSSIFSSRLESSSQVTLRTSNSDF